VKIVAGVTLFYRYLPERSVLWYKNENMYIDARTNERKSFPAPSAEPAVYLTLVVPAYNEEKRMPTMLDETLAYLQQRSAEDPQFTYEIVVVDDGSRDKTTDVALSYAKQHKLDTVRVLKLAKNRGKGGAVRRVPTPPLRRIVLWSTSVGKCVFASALSALSTNRACWLPEEDMR
jgi:dolichyl-phosphate beta-glucosyltransferase